MSSDQRRLLATSLNTTHGYYDEVVALSQRIVNDGFESFWKTKPEMKELKFEHKSVGKINGNLLAPRVLFFVDQLNVAKILYQIRFQSGRMTAKDPDDFDEDVSGWNLAVKCDLEKQNIAVDPQADPATQEKQRKWVKFMQERFNVPGDYSIKSLFAKITDAKWDDFDYNNSSFGKNPNGSGRSWDELIKHKPEIEYSLPIMLRKWVRTQEEAGLTTLGVSFTLPPPQQTNPLKPRYEPTAMIHQTYPYINPERGVPKAVTSYEPPGDVNCLLYCEMVEGSPLPQDQRLASTGNFTTMAEKIGGPRIDGTFVLSHQLFLERFLLPQLQPFNMDSGVFPTTSYMDWPGDGARWNWEYSVGSDSRYPTADNPVFEFKPDDLRNPKSFSFTLDNKKTMDGSPVKHPSLDAWYTFESSGIPKVTINWVLGENKFTVKGETDYKYDAEGADNREMRKPYSWARDTFNFTWSFDIVIESIDAGVMKIIVNTGSQGKVNVSVKTTRHDANHTSAPPGQDERIRSEISSRLSKSISTLVANLQAAFQSTGKFVYPGNGTLNFEKPMLSLTGEVISEIKYKPLDPGQKTDIPKPSNFTLKPPEKIPTKIDRSGVVDKIPVPKLSWTAPSPIQGNATAVKFSLTGRNETDAIIDLSKVTFTFCAKTDGRAILTSPCIIPGEITVALSDPVHPDNICQATDFPRGSLHLAPVSIDKETSTIIPEQTNYTAIVSPVDDLIKVEPQQSILLSFVADTGVPGTYKFHFQESWPPEFERSSDSLRTPLRVVLKP